MGNLCEPQSTNDTPIVSEKEAKEIQKEPSVAILDDHQQDLSDFEKNIFKYTNLARRSAGLKELVHDKKLQQLAKDWNQFLKDNEACTIRHPISTDTEKNKYLPNNYGQNLYSSFGYPTNPKGSAKDAVSAWYSECLDYKKPNPGQEIPDNFKKIGHFTQLMWEDASKMGCDQMDCPKSMSVGGKMVNALGKIITCNYDKGNVGGQFQSKVIYSKCPFDNLLNESA